MMNSINWIDGLDGLSSGMSFIAAVTLGVISLTTQVGQPLIAVLCFALAGALLGFLRWNFHPASIFAGTSGVQFVGLHAGGAGHPRHGEGRRCAARARRPDHRHVLDHRPARLAGRLAVHPGQDAHPSPAARSRAVASPDGAGHLRDLHRARRPGDGAFRASTSSTRSSASSCCSDWSCSSRPVAISSGPTSWRPRPTSRARTLLAPLPGRVRAHRARRSSGRGRCRVAGARPSFQGARRTDVR